MTTAACGAGHAAEPGRATIGMPATNAPADPFSTGGRVPTPFVPYASQGTDLDPALRGLGRAAPTTSSPAPQPITISPSAPQPIGGGDLVPVVIPSAGPLHPTAKTEPVTQPAADTLEPLTPIRPAVMSTERPTTTGTKAKKPKSPANVAPAPAATSPPPAEPETARPPIRFSFPQPIIPLESALRRWFGRSQDRG